MFKVHSHLLKYIYSSIVKPSITSIIKSEVNKSKQFPNMEFLVSLLFHHIKVDASNLGL